MDITDRSSFADAAFQANAVDAARILIRVVLADDHRIVRDGLRKLLTLEDDIEVVGEASNGLETIRVVQDTRPDVVILDLRMPHMDGLAALQALKQIHNKAKIIMLTASEDKSEFIEATKLGCSGILLKQMATELMVKCIRKVFAGEIWLDPRTTATVIGQFASPEHTMDGSAADRQQRPTLSIREREIVGLVAQGYKNREIAQKLLISEQTVKNHLHNVFDKVKVSDRVELALYAIQNGIYVMQSGEN